MPFWLITSDKSNELDALEEKVFHQTYTKDPVETRILRLEEFLFGQKQVKGTIEERFKKINSAINPEAEKQKNRETGKKENPSQNIILNQSPEQSEGASKESSNGSGAFANTQNDNNSQVIYDESFNVGVVGAVNQIEEIVFNMVFNNVAFPARVANLEDKLLSKSEVYKSRKKPLMERVQKLVQKSGLQQNYKPSPIQLHQAPQQQQGPNTYGQRQNYPNKPQSYTIDPNTGYLINEQTNEIVRDNFGNPISVKMPQVNLNQPIPQQNYYNNQIPLNNRAPQYPQQGYQNNAPYGLPTNPGFPQTQIPYDLLFNQEENQNNDQDY